MVALINYSFIIVFVFHILLCNGNDKIDRFKRAVNRTFIGFEKENGQQWTRDFYFIQAADTQFGMISTYIEHNPNGSWDKDIALTREAIKEWNKMTPLPAFVAICGDLVDAYPGDEPRRSLQLKDFKNVLNELNENVPLVLLGGNHDFLNSPTNESIAEYKKIFGDDYYAFWFNGCMFIVINVQYYKNHTFVNELHNEHDLWIEEKITKAKNGHYKHVIVLQHIPWFLHNATEPDDYFNFPLGIRTKMIEKFHKAGVRAIFAGHYHRNAGGMYNDMELVVTSAIGAQSLEGRNANSGYRIVNVTEDKIEHYYVDIKFANGSSIIMNHYILPIFATILLYCCMSFIMK